MHSACVLIIYFQLQKTYTHISNNFFLFFFFEDHPKRFPTLFLRPTTVLRNTYDNIKTSGKYTINHIHEGILEDAHHTSAKYTSDISEFDVTGLEEDYKDNFIAPFVKDCPIQLAMSYVEEYPIKANNTILLIGKIEKLYVPDALLDKDGFINLSKGKIAAINGLDGYAVPKLKTRLEYQRPKKGYSHRDH